MKRLIAALMCIAMLLALAACSKPAEQQSSGNNNEVKDPDVYGMLLLGMNAAVSVSYDKEGLVLSVAGENEMGEDVAKTFDKVLGSSCSKVIADLITAASDTSYAADLKVVVLKQALGSQVPTDKFLEGIRMEAEKVAADRTVVLVTTDALTEDGYLDLDAAKEILGKHLGQEASAIEGEATLSNGTYWLTATEAGVSTQYTVNANNGFVEQAPSEEGFEGSPDTPSDEFYDPSMDMTDSPDEEFDPFEGMEDIIWEEDDATQETTEATTDATTDAA